MTGLVHTLAELAACVADDDDDGAERLWRSLPVADRGALAALILAAADRPVNQKQIADVGRFTRSQFTPGMKPSRQRTADELMLAQDAAPAVATYLLGAGRPARTLTDAEADVQDRDRTIALLRGQVDALSSDLEVLRTYARSVHERLYPEILENLRTRDERVIDARPRLVALPKPTDQSMEDDDDQ